MGAALERLFPLNEFTDSTDFYESNLRQAKMVTQLAINFYRRACTEEDIYLDAFFQGALLSRPTFVAFLLANKLVPQTYLSLDAKLNAVAVGHSLFRFTSVRQILYDEYVRKGHNFSARMADSFINHKTIEAACNNKLLRSICEQADCLDEDTSYTLNTYKRMYMKAMTASAEFFEVLFDRFSIVVTEPSSLATKDINIHTLNTTKNLRDFLIESVEVELLAHGLPDKLIAGYTHGLFSRDGFGKRLGRRQINDMLTIMPLGKLAELM